MDLIDSVSVTVPAAFEFTDRLVMESVLSDEDV